MARKTKNKKTKKDVIIKLVSVIAIIIVLFIAYNFISNLQTIQMPDKECVFFQYVMGRKIEYTGALKMTKKDGVTELTTNEGVIYLDSIPLYYKDEIDKVILPEDMAIAFPMEKGTLRKVNSFSNVYVEYGETYIEKGSLNRRVENAFLYDSEDLYFFIENTTVKVNGEEYKLPPLSYVNATYKGYVEIYNHDTEEYTYIEEVEGDVIAVASNYTINLSVDTLICGENEQLLLKRIKTLPNLE